MSLGLRVGVSIRATLRERDGNSTPSTTLEDSLARNACHVMGRGLGMSTSLTWAMGSPLFVATRLKLRTWVFVFMASHSSVSMGIGMSCQRGTGGDGGLRNSHVSSYPNFIIWRMGSHTFILLRFTSSSSLSLLRTLFNISSIFVGFGGSSGTGLYLSGCTTPVGEGRKETLYFLQSLLSGFSYHLCTCLLPNSPVSSLATFP